ncbi:hypothetical protein PV04_02606 [Phialophora macrospora]|uniref:Uncharacterized protein n=1 Tax=Phialophora macrospora TaxID=1851006 RepID=A0A0D2FPT3_9EURO|nr:hypothetical protein PV04_02606 [Phialophora macrospora]
MAQSFPTPQPKPWETLPPHQEAMVEACKTGRMLELKKLFNEHHVKNGSQPISYYQAEQEGAPATDLLFKAAISHGQQSIVRCLYSYSTYPTYDFHNPCIVMALGTTRNIDMLKLICSYCPRIVSYSFDDHMTSMMSLAIAQAPENGPFIHFLLDHGAIFMNDGGYLVHGRDELGPAIEYNQPIDVIKKMIPKTRFLISPRLMAIDHKRADAVEVLLPEDHARRRQVGMEDYSQEPLKAAQKTKDKDTIAVVERFIHKVEQQDAKEAAKKLRASKKWWQFGTGANREDITGGPASSNFSRPGGTSWWSSLSQSGHGGKSADVSRQEKKEKESYDSSTDEEAGPELGEQASAPPKKLG